MDRLLNFLTQNIVNNKFSIYDIPNELLQSNTQKDQSSFSFTHSQNNDKVGNDMIREKMSTLTVSNKLTCLKCDLVFMSVEQQIEHYKSELHRVNLKRYLCGQMNPLRNVEELTKYRLTLSPEEQSSSDEDNDDDDDEDDNNNYHKEDNYEHLLSADLEFDFDNDEAVYSNKDVSGDESPKYQVVYTKADGPKNVIQYKSPGLAIAVSPLVIQTVQTQDNITGDAPVNSITRIQQQLFDSLVYLNKFKFVAVFMLQSGRFAAAIFCGDSIVKHKVVFMFICLLYSQMIMFFYYYSDFTPVHSSSESGWKSKLA